MRYPNPRQMILPVAIPSKAQMFPTEMANPVCKHRDLLNTIYWQLELQATSQKQYGHRELGQRSQSLTHTKAWLPSYGRDV